jgi:hypothetical protein
LPNTLQPANSGVQITAPDEPRFKETVIITLEPEDAQWLLDMAKAEYVEFLKDYPKGRDYPKQQRAERIAAALGVRLSMFNKGDNTYSISQSDIPLEK